MDWMEWAAIAQIVGTIAVVLSLLYLAREVNHAAKVAKAESNRDAANSYSYFQDLLSEENRQIHTRGLAFFDSLSRDEQFHFHCTIHPLIHQAQSIFKDYEAGLIEKELQDAWEHDMAALLSTPGGAVWWSEARHLFAKSYVESLDRYMKTGKAKSMFEIAPFFAPEDWKK